MSAPYYYSFFHAQGRDLLAEELGTDDPFGPAPEIIVARMLAAGHEPLFDLPQLEPFRQ